MDLVVMAAGMGSRFGGLKQLQSVDEDKNFIIDYSVYDAIKAGFDKVIFIIKKENYNLFRDSIGKRLEKHIKVEYAFQELLDVPAGTKIPSSRVKPWGTGHAIYTVRNMVSDKFAVINADDFYGYESFKLVGDFLKYLKDDSQFICAGYYAINTLSTNGIVKRGRLLTDGNVATGLVESEIKLDNGELCATPLGQNKWETISKNTLVSMSMFGFTKKLIKEVEKEFYEFFTQPEDMLEKAEFLLPDCVNNLMNSNQAVLNVATTPAKWYGITYKEDLQTLQDAITQMKVDGKYPKHLY